MQFEIKNRRTGKVQVTAEIDCAADTPVGVKIGLAVKFAYETHADLTHSDLWGADLRGADLWGADLTGSDLTGSDLMGSVLRGAVLTHAVLRGSDLTGSDLTGSDLTGSDLTGSVLTHAVLTGSDLMGSVLRGAVLTHAVLRDIPVIPDIHKAVYAAASHPGALNMSDWHACETTHCRAGWVVTLAGEEGKALEDSLDSTAAAATLIYLASDPALDRVPDFYCSNAIALADMKALAATQVAA